MKYDYKNLGMTDEEAMKYSPHLDKLDDHGISQDQLGAVLGAVLDIADMDTVDLGEPTSGSGLQQLMEEYTNFVQNEDFDKKKRLGFIQNLIAKADDEDSAKEAFEVYL